MAESDSPSKIAPTQSAASSALDEFSSGGVLRRVAVWSARFADSFLFDACLTNPEMGRRARLISRFGLVGFLFALCFAAFYWFIEHFWGAAIVTVCGLGCAAVPGIMRATRSLDIGGNALVAIMTACFTALCFVEGGLFGHAIAWLAIVPLCALLLVGKRSAKWWVVVCFAIVSAVVEAALLGIELPTTYPHEWHTIVSATGYLALVAFLFVLGMIFETVRETAFNKLQDALAKLGASNEQLVRLNNEKNEFLGIAAHDLKNPLTTIIMGADMMHETKPAPQHTDIIQSISQAGNRMRDLISNLLDANAIESGHFISKFERCDLNALLAESVADNTSSATRKNIALTIISRSEAWARVDRAATVQIFDNFISNAIKYSPFGSTVQLSTRTAGDLVSLNVIDQGPGLSVEDQKKLFQKFTRLSAKPTGGESSNGLGLSIVKRLAEAMGGSVHCQSVLGKGSTFIVDLPAWRDGDS